MNAGIVAALVKGATVIPHAVFDVDAVMKRAAEEQVSMLPGPPTIYQSMLDHPRIGEFDMTSLRLAVTGAAPVPVELIRRMRAELGFETIVTGYGLTEATGIATMCRHDDDPETISTTSGRAIPDVEVRIINDEGAEVPRGEPGEVVIRGYNIMRGFIHDPAATAEAIDAEGWLHTGDVAVMNDRGYITITDRTKDMFIVGGFNAYPAEIENMINEHPAVASVAIIGVPDDRMGEVGYAYVIPRLNATITPDELRSVVPRQDGQLQGAALLRDRRRGSAQRGRQGVEVRTARARAGEAHSSCVVAKQRCAWAESSDLMRAYHDDEWGVPSRDDTHLFEMLMLEGAQAGLSWSTILNKRANYRRAFDGFDVAQVARYSEEKLAKLMEDPGIVRNRLKVASSVRNAKAFVAVQKEYGSFADYLWAWVDGKPIVNRPAHDGRPPDAHRVVRSRVART